MNARGRSGVLTESLSCQSSVLLLPHFWTDFRVSLFFFEMGGALSVYHGHLLIEAVVTDAFIDSFGQSTRKSSNKPLFSRLGRNNTGIVPIHYIDLLSNNPLGFFIEARGLPHTPRQGYGIDTFFGFCMCDGCDEKARGFAFFVLMGENDGTGSLLSPVNLALLVFGAPFIVKFDDVASLRGGLLQESSIPWFFKSLEI